MKVKYEFDTVDMGDEIILVPTGEDARKVNGVVKLNASALEIINLLKTNSSEPGVVEALAAKYENNKGDLQRYVNKVVNILLERGLIEE